ncbi:hypothetical protein BZL30_9483 [Mycobacterium kansasii]|uniref:Uncharacterized protein n=1 Tax=Mycobacterium kansasii TaxID=1768 RepID=A0A1V3W8X0_MYCKA|nr:hypothetical protein BZL30_9483 [Mycobacterium kansasii]
MTLLLAVRQTLFAKTTVGHVRFAAFVSPPWCAGLCRGGHRLCLGGHA